MRLPRERLIGNLVADLRPVRRPGRVVHWVAVWLALALAFSAAAIAATGPYRPGAFSALFEFPGFMAETFVAAAAIVLLARATLSSALPDPRPDLQPERLLPVLPEPHPSRAGQLPPEPL